MADVEYVLGYDALELRRLEMQARLFEAGTERILRAAGLGPGQRVLDIGAGAGDVSMLASAIVGPTGSVLGIDREASSIDRARARAAGAGLGNVAFQSTAFDDLSDPGPFDAVIGRYVLMYQPDRAGFLRDAARRVRPGGTLLFIEPGLPVAETPEALAGAGWSHPPVALYDDAVRWILQAFERSGARIGTGAELVRLFRDARLPEPEIAHEVPTGGPRSNVVAWVCLTLRSVAVSVARRGVALPAGFGDLDTLQARMEAAARASASQMTAAQLIGGWVEIPR